MECDIFSINEPYFYVYGNKVILSLILDTWGVELEVYLSCPVKRILQVNALVTAFCEAYDAAYAFSGEAHDFWELVCVLEGQAGVLAGTAVYSLRKGQAVLHPPAEFHRIWSEGKEEMRILILSFHARILPELRERVRPLPPGGMEALNRLLREICSAYRMDGISVREECRGQEAEAQRAVLHLEEFLLDFIRERPSPVRPAAGRKADAYRQIVRILEGSVGRAESLPEIAAHCGMSASSLKRIFSEYAGIGVMQYFQMLKVKRAAQLLEAGCTVQAAGLAVGFSDQNYFSTVFKRVTGMPPSQYRRGITPKEEQEKPDSPVSVREKR